MIGALLLAAMLLNAAYCIAKILEDWRERNRAMAAFGLTCVIGLNGIMIWLIYDIVASSTDL